MTLALPEFTIQPAALSPELHFLLVLSDDSLSPTTRIEALRRIRRRYPEYGGLGKDPRSPTDTAVQAWNRLIQAAPGHPPDATYVQHGDQVGFVLTPSGAARRDRLWENQAFAPYLRRVRAECGDAVADALAARERR